MRIGLVARCLNTQHIRGMGRYVYELLVKSKAHAGIDWTIYGDDPRHALTVPEHLAGNLDVFPFKGDRFHLWEQIGLPRRARAQRIDVLHCTEGSLPLWQPVPTVVTVHDTLVWQERDDSLVSRIYHDKVLPAALTQCACVITISESSKRDIIAKWPHLEPKVVVIPHGIGEEYLDGSASPAPSELQRSLGERPFLVYLGGPLARKRFDWAVQVLLACGHPEMQLVACGFTSESHGQQRATLVPAARARVHFAPFLPDEQLRALYRGCRAVLYPTLYEGFGFPAIEAQASGAPAVFASISSLAELTGPLSLSPPADDLSQWAEAVRQCHQMSAQEREQRAGESLVWAKQYSWQQSFDRHRQVYARALRIQ